VAVNDVRLYLYNTSEGQGRWQLGENVAGWLHTTTEEKVEGGVTYAGFQIRHGGIIRLGMKPGNALDTKSAASMSGGQQGVWLLFSLAALALLLNARRRRWTR
jgi:hypothetical protein